LAEVGSVVVGYRLCLKAQVVAKTTQHGTVLTLVFSALKFVSALLTAPVAVVQ
jgi:hypothetical protein